MIILLKSGREMQAVNDCSSTSLPTIIAGSHQSDEGVVKYRRLLGVRWGKAQFANKTLQTPSEFVSSAVFAVIGLPDGMFAGSLYQAFWRSVLGPGQPQTGRGDR